MNNTLEFALRTFGNLLSPAGPNGLLSILIYHRVFREIDPLLPDVVDAARFESQMEVLGSLFNILPLSEAVQRLKSGTLPARAACITFDDGYADNAEVALPILKRHKIPATFFIATGYLNGGIMFNDKVIEVIRRLDWGGLDLSDMGLGVRSLSTLPQRKETIKSLLSVLKYRPVEERRDFMDRIIDAAKLSLPTDLMMRTEQVKMLSDAGMEIGGHTVNHPIIAKLDMDSARAEIDEGRIRLEEMTGKPVSLFAYPNGIPSTDYRYEHARMIEEMGFDAAVSTAKGVGRFGCDVFQLPRFTPWDIPLSRFSFRLTGNLLRTEILTA
ncbi:MAG: polysaccharide deacetylase family protein [Burkholderiales bacterium]|nr:polysaccharide deacetylase family protein [Burkholderiales bacterium]